MENEVVETLEEALIQVEGVRTLTSSSRQGSCNITVEIELSRDVDLALQDVQAKVSQAARRLPRDMDPPITSKQNPEDQPIMMARLAGPYPQRVLSDYVRYGLKERLQTIPGIGEISLMGTLERNIRIWLDAARLDEKGLTVRDVISALQREHIELPAGLGRRARRSASASSAGRRSQTLRKMVVREVSEPIYLSTSPRRGRIRGVRRLARMDGGRPGIGIRSNAAPAPWPWPRRPRTIDEYRKTLPSDMTSSPTTADSSASRSARSVRAPAVVVLTAFVCWLFLGSLSSTLNVILAIPMSLLGTVAIIYFLGFTFNTFTLLALALAVGIVVDDAIMVMENIFRHREGGKALVPAALEGTKEIAFAALAATLAVVAIFLPVVFMKGIIGRYFLQFGITLCLAVPVLCRGGHPGPGPLLAVPQDDAGGRNKVGLAVDRAFRKLEGLWPRPPSRPPPARPGPRPRGGPLRRGHPRLHDDAERVRALPGPEPDHDPYPDRGRLGHLRDRRAPHPGGGCRQQTSRDHTDLQLRRRHGRRRRGQFRDDVPDPGPPVRTEDGPGRILGRAPPGVEFHPRHPGRHPGHLPARLHGPARLPDRVLLARRRLASLCPESEGHGRPWASGTSDLDSDYRVGMPELRVSPDRAVCADVGVSVDDVATTINALVGGIRVGKYSTGGRRLDVRLKLMAGQRSRPEDISRLRVRASNGELVPLSSLVIFEEQAALQAITAATASGPSRSSPTSLRGIPRARP
jgi:hypothetical protein